MNIKLWARGPWRYGAASVVGCGYRERGRCAGVGMRVCRHGGGTAVLLA